MVNPFLLFNVRILFINMREKDKWYKNSSSKFYGSRILNERMWSSWNNLMCYRIIFRMNFIFFIKYKYQKYWYTLTNISKANPSNSQPNVFWHISWKKRKYTYSSIHVWLYYKFEKSKIKNKNSFVFITYQYLSWETPSFRTCDYSDGMHTFCITFFSMDYSEFSRWTHFDILCIFIIFPLYWL